MIGFPYITCDNAGMRALKINIRHLFGEEVLAMHVCACRPCTKMLRLADTYLHVGARTNMLCLTPA